MAESHATLNSIGQTTTPLAISGNFSVTIEVDSDWKGAIVLEKKFSDKVEYIPLKDGLFFRSDTMIGHEPGVSVVEYRFRVFKHESGSAYVRIEDGN